MLNLLSVVSYELEGLSKVKCVVKIFGFVNSIEDFMDQFKVMDGVLDLFVKVFGDKGKYVCLVVGMVQFFNNIVVEIEMVLEIEDEEDI